MLKEKTVTTNVIMAVKLVSGEEIIAKKLDSFNSDEVRFSRPLALVMGEVPGNPQQTQVMFTPWMLALPEDQAVDIKRSHILSMAPARADAAKQYESATNAE